jgi:hypothetical protein
MDIHFTDGTSYERAAPLAEKNAAAVLSGFSVRGAARQHFLMNVQSACVLNTLYIYIIACRALLCNDCEMGGYTKAVSGQRLSKIRM